MAVTLIPQCYFPVKTTVSRYNFSGTEWEMILRTMNYFESEEEWRADEVPQEAVVTPRSLVMPLRML
jgi:hypothetical protein